MSLIRFENSGQARNYVEDMVESFLGCQNFKISDEVVAMASFKSFTEFDEAYYVETEVITNSLSVLNKLHIKE